MQSYNDKELIQTLRGSLDELRNAIPSNATHSIIGMVPVANSEVTINGLVWVVERVNEQAGWMRLRIKKPAQCAHKSDATDGDGRFHCSICDQWISKYEGDK